MKPVEVNDATFETEVLRSETPVLVDFWAVWCGPCKNIAPVLEEMAKEYSGKLKIAKVDVDKNPEASVKFGIRSIPTLLLFKEGKVVDQVIGGVPKKNIVDMVQPHLLVN